MKEERNIKIVHKNDITNIYDADGNDLTKQFHIHDAKLEFEACAAPKLTLTIVSREVDVEIDNCKCDIIDNEYPNQ